MNRIASMSLRPHQVRVSHAFGPVRITTLKHLRGETVVYAKSADGQELTLSARYCSRLPLAARPSAHALA